jgi:hypothetical protein
MLRGGVGLGIVVSIGVSIWILFSLHGWQYYHTPLAVRGYASMHRALRPAGPFGQTFGVVGAALLLVPFLYMIRKRLARSNSLGGLRLWLEVHLFCGIVGPVLVTFHTSFKFNGIVSAAYWSMMIVMLSGFVGRYLYVRIPRTLRGTELTRTELDQRADDLRTTLAASTGAGPWLEKISALEHAAAPGRGSAPSFIGLLFGELALRRRLRGLAHEIKHSSLSHHEQHDLIALMTERAILLRRIALLQKTKKAFSMWHVFHVPLVYLALVIVTAHIALALYMGYVPFRW